MRFRLGVIRLLGPFLILGLWLGTAGISALAPGELRVPQDYGTIQEAIDAARPGDVISVEPGAYVENLRIDVRELAIRGTDPDASKVVIRAKFPEEPVVLIRERDVRLSNLTLTGGLRGIEIESRADDPTLFNLIMRGNSRDGLFLEEIRSGELSESLVEGNGAAGVYVGSRANFRLEANRIIGNRTGVEALNATLELRENLISGNVHCGLKVDEETEVVGTDNAIFRNGQDLCGAAQGREDLLDRTPPPAPRNLTVSPAEWTNQGRFVVEWQDPRDPAGIVAYWFKVGDSPTAPDDGTRREINAKPLVIENPSEGEQPVYVWLEDGMGHKDHRNRDQVTLHFDKTPPTISYHLEPLPNEHGWYNSDVTVCFECEDNPSGSGIARCTKPVTVAQEGKGLVVKGEAVDRAGNRAEARVTVNIDKTPPLITPEEPQGERGENGWFVSDVSVTFTVKDVLSGLANPSQAHITLSTKGEGQALYIETGPICDLAGNKAQAKLGPFKVDKTPPQTEISLDPPRPDGQRGWYIHPVKVRYICSDTVSGLSTETPCPQQETISQDGVHKLSLTIKDRAGHIGHVSKIVKLDQTPPRVKCDVPDTESWYTEDVSVRCIAEDATSGLANPEDASFTLKASGEGESVSTGTHVVFDQAGNSVTAGPFTFKIDKTRPAIKTVVIPRPNEQGWNKEDVTVRFDCFDRLSGIKSCPQPVTITKEVKGQVVSGEAIDQAGNRSSATVTVNLDKTAPIIRIGEPQGKRGQNGWWLSDVSVTFTATDNLSGFTPEGNLTAEVTTRTLGEGENLMIYASFTDLAGNEAKIQTGPFKVDKTPPKITPILIPHPNRNGWNNGEVEVRFACEDAVSGVASCPDPVKLTEEGKGQVIRGEATDRAGNRAETSVTVNIDKQKPKVQLGEPRGVLGREGWYVSDVIVPFTATDNLSGFAPDGKLRIEGSQRSSGEGSNIRIGISVSDLAGNTTEVTAGPFKIDKTPPTLTAQPSHPPDHNGWYNRDVSVSFKCDDRVSGVASCTPATPVTIDQEGQDQVVQGEAVDKAGNRATATIKISLDKTPPTGSLLINEGAAIATSIKVMLRISADDNLSGVSEMRFSNDGRTWSPWEPFRRERTGWDLSRFGGNSNEGNKTVWGQVRDRAGNISDTFKASIKFTLTLRVPQDFKSIQDAIDAAEDGCTILIRFGTYRENLFISKSLILKGAGRGRTVLKGIRQGWPVIRIESERSINVTVQGLTITGAQALPDHFCADRNRYLCPGGIQIWGQVRTLIKDNMITNNADDGVDVLNKGYAKIVGNLISGNGYEGIHVQNGSQAEIVDNEVSSNGEIGVLIWRSSRAEIKGNKIANTRLHSQSKIGDGIEVIDDSTATIEDNTITGNARYGIFVGGSYYYADPSWRFLPSTVRIINNKIENNRYVGIYVNNSTAIIEKNTIKNNRDRGIWGQDYARLTIASNTITSNVVAGIGIGPHTTAEIRGNEVSHTQKDRHGDFGRGIDVEDYSEVTVAENNIHGNKENGIIVLDGSHVIITNNRITNNREYGIFVDASSVIRSCFGNVLFGNGSGNYGGVAKGKCH